MLTAGLTGGIAMGKSLVAREFKRLGAEVIDADGIAHHFIDADKTVRQELLGVFGERIFKADGSLDRRRLGEIIFSDRCLREKLNAIVHPRVIGELERRIDSLGQQNPQAIIILEVPLLVETGLYKRVDKVIVVNADEEAQIHRLMQRNGLSLDQALGRIKAQWPMMEKLALADYVIENNGSPEEIADQVRQIYQELQESARKTLP